MMAISVDRALCSGCGLCIELCAEVFGWDSDGKAVVIKATSESCNLEELSAQCPMEAIDV